MTYLRQFIVAGIAIWVSLFSLTAFASRYEFVCKRAIYNNTNSYWKFKFLSDTGIKLNGTFFPTGTTIRVLPYSEVFIEYYTADYLRGSFGDVHIEDSTGETKAFNYYGKGNDECVHIIHQGYTGSVSMNEPHDGDFRIDKNTW